MYARHQDKALSADGYVPHLLEMRALLEYPNSNEPWCDVHPIALPLVLEQMEK